LRNYLEDVNASSHRAQAARAVDEELREVPLDLIVTGGPAVDPLGGGLEHLSGVQHCDERSTG
jgi:hypothetical protein